MFIELTQSDTAATRVYQSSVQAVVGTWGRVEQRTEEVKERIKKHGGLSAMVYLPFTSSLLEQGRKDKQNDKATVNWNFMIATD